MSYKPIHPIAQKEAHNFVALLFDELPQTWHDDMASAQFDLELWLSCFTIKVVKDRLFGLDLLGAARKRANSYYADEIAQPHHTPEVAAFFKLQLQLASLRTVSAAECDLQNCLAYYCDVLFPALESIGWLGGERVDKSYSWAK